MTNIVCNYKQGVIKTQTLQKEDNMKIQVEDEY
jgi:hypothetical protein